MRYDERGMWDAGEEEYWEEECWEEEYLDSGGLIRCRVSTLPFLKTLPPS